MLCMLSNSTNAKISACLPSRIQKMQLVGIVTVKLQSHQKCQGKYPERIKTAFTALAMMSDLQGHISIVQRHEPLSGFATE